MKHVALLLALGLAFVTPCVAQNNRGVICVPPLPDPSAAVGEPPMTPPGQYVSPAGTLLIHVDKRKPVVLSSAAGGSVGGLALGRRHTVRISRAKKTLASFRFSFEEQGSRELCLWYYPGYGTFTLRPAAGCACGKR